MKIQFASDLHFEFHDNSRWLRENPIIPESDILVLAGDIGYFCDDVYLRHPFWKWCSDNFKETYIIPGNHELYKRFDINGLVRGWSMKIKANVHAVYNKLISLTDDIDLVASTLWSHIHREEAYSVMKGVSDFRRIRNGEELMDWQRFNYEHEICKQFIEKSVKSSGAKHIIVATHHVPSFQLMSDEFKGSNINGAFASNLDNMIQSLPVEYWIYGHSHRNIDKKIGSTMFLSNQLGYVFNNEQISFNRSKFLEI